jgi:beta-lactamase regulating signal transducer with metallopeptidase domain
MAWPTTIDVYQGLVRLAGSSLIVLLIATAAVIILRQPARRVRVIQWTLGGLIALPLPALAPGYPRWLILPTTMTIGTPAPDSTIAWDLEVSPHEPISADPATVAIPESVDTRNIPTELNRAPLPELLPTEAPSRQREFDPIAEPTWELSSESHSDLPAIDQAGPSTIDFRPWVVMAYLTIVVAMTLWSIVGLIAVKRLLRDARPADQACRELLRQIAGPKSDRVALAVSSRIVQPCAVAWRRPTIVLPERLCSSDHHQELRWALAHEWSHIQHGDVWTWSLAGFVCGLYFYQPLAWWLRRHLQLCQDYIADAQAVRAGATAEDYADFLTSRWLTPTITSPPLAAGLGIGGRSSDLTRRVVMLVERSDPDNNPLETASPRRWNFAVLPIAVLLVAGIASIGEKHAALAASAEDTPPPRKTAEAEPAPPVESNEASPVQPTTAPQQEEQASSDFVRDIEVNKDPLIFNLSQKLAQLKEALKEKTRAERKDELRREIVQLEEELDQSKATLRAKLIEQTLAEQRKSAQRTPNVLQKQPNTESTQERERRKQQLDESAVADGLIARLAAALQRLEDDLASATQSQDPKSLADQQGQIREIKGQLLKLLKTQTGINVWLREQIEKLDQPVRVPTADVQQQANTLITNLSGELERVQKALDEESKKRYPDSKRVQQLEFSKNRAAAMLQDVKAARDRYIAEQSQREELQRKVGHDFEIEVALSSHPTVRALTDKLSHLKHAQAADRYSEAASANTSRAAELKIAVASVASELDKVKAELRSKFVAMLAVEQSVDWLRDQQSGQREGDKPPSAGKAYNNRYGGSGGIVKIAPGDILHIEVEPEDRTLLRSKTVVVEPSGKIPLSPRLGRVGVAGKTLEEAEEVIRKVLEPELREPRVQVTSGGRSMDGTANAESPSVQNLQREVEELKQMIRELRAGKLPAQVVPLAPK